MPKVINYSQFIGQKINRLTITNVIKSKITLFETICECGNNYQCNAHHVMVNHTKSCGCLLREVTAKRCKTHGLVKHPIYRMFNDIKARCSCIKSTSYKNYGARGISICKEWENDFMLFYNWCLNNGWRKDLQIDRKNNDGNYEPDNCRFITRKENCNNRRNNKYIKYNGEILTVSQWSDKTGITAPSIYCRLNKSKWSIEKALTTPTNSYVKNSSHKPY